MIDSKQIKIGGLDIHYYTGGKGEPLIRVHGGGSGGAKGWLQNIDELSQYFTLYIPDLPGFGLSQSANDDCGINGYVDFLNDFASSLDLDSFYLAGHSVGGGIAMRYAVNFRKKVKKLVLIDSMGLGKELSFLVHLSSHPAMYRTIGITLVAVVKSLKQIVNRVCSRLGFINPLPLALILLGGSVVIFRQEADVWVAQLAAMMIPTLLIWGARDKIVPVSNAYNAARIIPDCKVHVFEDGGHNVHKYKAKELTSLLTEFLT